MRTLRIFFAHIDNRFLDEHKLFPRTEGTSTVFFRLLKMLVLLLFLLPQDCLSCSCDIYYDIVYPYVEFCCRGIRYIYNKILCCFF